jgi:pimeloyl-ACP methyl ester carboxylesterase
MPVLVVAGALDDKFRALAGATVEAIGRNARLAIVAGAGHAVFLERPGTFVELVRDFLDPDAHPAVNRAGQSPIPRANRAPNAS